MGESVGRCRQAYRRRIANHKTTVSRRNGGVKENRGLDCRNVRLAGAGWPQLVEREDVFSGLACGSLTEYV